MSPFNTRLLLGAGLLAVVLLAVFAPRDGDDATSGAGKPEGRKSLANTSDSLKGESVGESNNARGQKPNIAMGTASGSLPSALPPTLPNRDSSKLLNAFLTRSWERKIAPPPPQRMVKIEPVVQVQTAPQAPPLTMTLLGLYTEGNRKVAYMVRDDRVILAGEGDLVDQQYKVEKITGDDVVLTYLPLGIQQTLNAQQTPQSRSSP
jgi:hypothetical protein